MISGSACVLDGRPVPVGDRHHEGPAGAAVPVEAGAVAAHLEEPAAAHLLGKNGVVVPGEELPPLVVEAPADAIEVGDGDRRALVHAVTLADGGSARTEGARPGSQASYTPDMSACPSCGEENPERARFCLSCGRPLSAEGAGERATETRRRVTVLFTDVVGSTPLGERLDPEALREVMQRYFDAMRVAIERHEGTVEKFIGDAVMAVFGIPQIHEDDALRAVRAALDMQAALAILNRDLRARWGIELVIRTGINTGEVVAGDATAHQSLATGDVVNTAARLEQVAGAERDPRRTRPPIGWFAMPCWRSRRRRWSSRERPSR